MTAVPRDPPPGVPGLRTLGTGATDAAAGDDARFPQSGPLTIKASYLGSPAAPVFYASEDLAGNPITGRTADGVVESLLVPGLYFFDQIVSLDQFVAKWDEDDGLPPATELIATRHLVTLPSVPTGVTAVGGDAEATVSFSTPDNGGSAILHYTVTAVDSTTPGNGGQTQSNATSPIVVTGLTNGDHYTFTVVAVTAIGSSPASAPSNSVIPAVVLYPPGAPTALTAVAGNGQVTVSFTPPANDGGSAITGYTATAVDETTPGNGGQTQSGAGSPLTVAALVNGDVYHFTVHATNAIGNSPESLPSNSVAPAGPGGPIAVFTATPLGSSSVYQLDATGSTGTPTWRVDGVDSPTHAMTLTIGPLKVGTHPVRLTTVGVGAAITQRNVDVAWIAQPLGDAQHDPTNGFPDSGLLLDQWDSLPPIGPWRNKVVLNEAEDYPAKGDGIPRITVYSPSHVSLLTKYGDRPGTAGGYRSAMEWTHSYVGGGAATAGSTTPPSNWATLLGYEFAAKGIQQNGIDVTGMGNFDGHSGTVRFYRIEMMIPSPTVGPPATNPIPLINQNNIFEFHGNIGGSAPMRYATDGAGVQIGWAFQAIQGGGANAGPIRRFDQANIVRDVYYRYVVEILWDLDPTVGYIRVYRDTGAGFVVIPIARCPAGTVSTPGPNYGKYFAATQQTDINGVVQPMSMQMENYRNKANMMPGDPDVIIHYEDVIVGPTLASVQ